MLCWAKAHTEAATRTDRILSNNNGPDRHAHVAAHAASAVPLHDVAPTDAGILAVYLHLDQASKSPAVL